MTLNNKNKILNILILGGGPIGLFIGYKLLKKNHNITIFEKRKIYTRHNILSLQESKKLDTISLMPSEIIEELNNFSSYKNINLELNNDNSKKKKIKKKPYFKPSSDNYYIILNEFEMAFEKFYKLYGGKIIKPTIENNFDNIEIKNNKLIYFEKNKYNEIELNNYDIIFINDGSNSYYRNLYFEKTSYTENIENNIIKYGLDENYQIKISNTIENIKPLAYGLIFIYDIKDKIKFSKDFNTINKMKKKLDYNTIFELENTDDLYLKGLKIKEIFMNSNIENINTIKFINQNIFRMFISDNYLYISIMININDIQDFYSKNKKNKYLFDELPNDIKIYILFSLHFYELFDLIISEINTCYINIFPLYYNSVKQSCTLLKFYNNNLEKSNSYYGIPHSKKFDFIDNNNKYKCLLLSGDSMTSGNFHSGFVLNRNLMAVNKICIMIDEYIDAYPKNNNGDLDNNFLRLLFFNVNILNQKTKNEILKKSFEVLINFKMLELDEKIYTENEIKKEFEIFFSEKKYNESFNNFIKNNIENNIFQRIFKYLLESDKYKYNNIINILS